MTVVYSVNQSSWRKGSWKRERERDVGGAGARRDASLSVAAGSSLMNDAKLIRAAVRDKAGARAPRHAGRPVCICDSGSSIMPPRPE